MMANGGRRDRAGRLSRPFRNGLVRPCSLLLNGAQQTTTLIHEALHALGLADDITAAKDAGVYDAGMTSAQASIAFQKWLNNNCPSKTSDK